MNKTIIVKSSVILVVLGVAHSVFWFFKTGQIEKQINNMISENSSYISAGEVSVSGFPLNQKISIKDLKFSIPNPAFSKYQITVTNLEANSGIFSNQFSVSKIEQVSVLDTESNLSGLVEFSNQPEISATISNNMITKFSYKDLGHRVNDADKNTIYASGSAELSLESNQEENEQIKTKVLANIKDIEGFDLLSIYKNSSEKKVIEGIKTGEITIGNSTNPSAPAADVVNTSGSTPTTTAKPTETPSTTTTTDNSGTVTSQDLNPALSTNVKSNFIFDAEYLSTPVQNGDAQIQSDPTQIQETPVQYSKSVKINNLEFSNPLYKILVNGQIDSFQDDSLPSGSITVKIEKSESLISYVKNGLTQIAEKKKEEPSTVQSADLNANNSVPANPSTTTPEAVATNSVTPSSDNNATNQPVVEEDPYQIFLKRFVAGLEPVAKELSTKNPLSKDDVAVFDIRREKNLDFLINETPTREILGKF